MFDSDWWQGELLLIQSVDAALSMSHCVFFFKFTNVVFSHLLIAGLL